MPKKKTAEEFETDFNLRMEDTKLSKKASKLFANDKEVQGRYNAFKDSKIDKTKLKNYVFNKYDISISETSSTILTTSCKIFLGEIVEKARELMSKDKLQGPIQPKYYKMAYKIVTEEFKGQIFEDNPYLTTLIQLIKNEQIYFLLKEKGRPLKERVQVQGNQI